MCFAERNAYLCSHVKLYDFINFASFLLAHVSGTADIDSCAAGNYIIRFSKLSLTWKIDCYFLFLFLLFFTHTNI